MVILGPELTHHTNPHGLQLVTMVSSGFSHVTEKIPWLEVLGYRVGLITGEFSHLIGYHGNPRN